MTTTLDNPSPLTRYLAERNAAAKAFVWKASAAAILAKLASLPAPTVWVTLWARNVPNRRTSLTKDDCHDPVL